MSDITAQPPEDAPGFFILKHYLFDLSVECPSGRIAGEEAARVAQGYDLHVKAAALPAENQHQVDIFIRLKASVEQRVIFMAELNYRVEVELRLIPEEDIAELLMVQIPDAMQPVFRHLFEQNGHWCGYPEMQVGDLDFARAYAQQKADTAP
jgi:preprotein translocase subunit SecB